MECINRKFLEYRHFLKRGLFTFININILFTMVNLLIGDPYVK